ncbi:MAG: hypothetical protein GF313_13750 [Caldithrix sp.]|nr:hypothetical protein [Caldithrix sp.]
MSINQNIEGKISAVTDQVYRISINDDAQECSTCGLKGICNTHYVEVNKSEMDNAFHTGQKVSIAYSKVIQTSFILYVLPLIFFFLGIVLTRGVLQIQNELILFVAALSLMGLAFWIVHTINNKYGSSKYKVRIEPINT